MNTTCRVLCLVLIVEYVVGLLKYTNDADLTSTGFRQVCGDAFDGIPLRGRLPVPTLNLTHFQAHCLSRAAVKPFDASTMKSCQGRLFHLAHKIYFGKQISRGTPRMWMDRFTYYSPKSGFYRPIGGGALYGPNGHSYLGIVKNAITTHTKCLVEDNHFIFIDEKELEKNVRLGKDVWAILREPMSHLESGFSEIEHFPDYKPCVAFLSHVQGHNSTHKRFKVAFERWLAADERCMHDPTAVYCCVTKNCAPIDQEAGWPWVHMAPQMWVLDFWSPNPDPHKRGTITKTFDMHSLHEVQEYLGLKKSCHKENERKTVFKRHDNVKQDVAQNATLEKAVCAFYARDYFCLGYELPVRCMEPELLDSICEALLPSPID